MDPAKRAAMELSLALEAAAAAAASGSGSGVEPAGDGGLAAALAQSLSEAMGAAGAMGGAAGAEAGSSSAADVPETAAPVEEEGDEEGAPEEEEAEEAVRSEGEEALEEEILADVGRGDPMVRGRCVCVEGRVFQHCHPFLSGMGSRFVRACSG